MFIPQFVMDYIRLNFGEKNITSHPNILFSSTGNDRTLCRTLHKCAKCSQLSLNQNRLVVMQVNTSGYDLNPQSLSGFIMASYRL